ncbi:L-seryl-tRNA(Sec) selenium transferase [Desulfovibrio sp. OttesenSCG-928-A18]|nr:L-seryl-tRNA(Sec) selenium transferase [Desulfovibrio sp. OttesenSCG-928-A18]
MSENTGGKEARLRLFRSLPSMNALLEAFSAPASDAMLCAEEAGLRSFLADSLPRTLLRESIEDFLGQCRQAIQQGKPGLEQGLALRELMPRIVRHVARVSRPHFRRVLNATGVVIHTNLGRSLLAQEAVQAVAEAARHYSNLEFDLQSGARGSRYSHVEALVCRLTGAEAALVVNNNAAAVLLMLDTLCKGREVIVSRGELVEIGGSFRIPAVMEKSGCVLREVGATNRTHPADYASAITEHTAALMKVHASNFRIIGFTSQVSREDLAALARERRLPLLEDLGSGTLFDFAAAGLPALASEPTAARVLAAGVDVVSFSGDKVLGGPQAGIIAGRAEYIDPIKRNPMNRALRIDKMTLAALEATLRLYLEPELAKRRIPTLRMICESPASLRRRAGRLLKTLQKELAGQPESGLSLTLRPGASRTGGGAFPELDLPTSLVCLHAAPGTSAPSPESLRECLLQANPPMLARVENNALCLDPRTLDNAEFSLAARSLCQALGKAAGAVSQ